MIINVSKQISITVDHWRKVLLELDDSTIRHKPADDRWSIAEVIGHLVDSASNNHHRFARATEYVELEFPDYQQVHWVDAAKYQSFKWEQLVELWHCYNQLLAHMIASIPTSRLEAPCKIGSNDSCTLGFLVEDYLEHLRHHLTKINQRLGVPVTQHQNQVI